MYDGWWLITYRWNDGHGVHVYTHDTYKGTIASWVLMAEKQPEDWRLINSVQITEEEAYQLDGRLA